MKQFHINWETNINGIWTQIDSGEFECRETAMGQLAGTLVYHGLGEGNNIYVGNQHRVAVIIDADDFQGTTVKTLRSVLDQIPIPDITITSVTLASNEHGFFTDEECTVVFEGRESIGAFCWWAILLMRIYLGTDGASSDALHYLALPYKSDNWDYQGDRTGTIKVWACMHTPGYEHPNFAHNFRHGYGPKASHSDRQLPRGLNLWLSEHGVVL